jgi:hypothetical protein
MMCAVLSLGTCKRKAVDMHSVLLLLLLLRLAVVESFDCSCVSIVHFVLYYSLDLL